MGNRDAAMTPGRRTLRYESLDEVMPDVERLLEGHTTVGNWTLAQICRALALIGRTKRPDGQGWSPCGLQECSLDRVPLRAFRTRHRNDERHIPAWLDGS